MKVRNNHQPSFSALVSLNNDCELKRDVCVHMASKLTVLDTFPHIENNYHQ